MNTRKSKLIPSADRLIEQQEDRSGQIVSHIPEILAQRGWGAMELVRAGFSTGTAYKLAQGSLKIYVDDTLERCCKIFELPVEKIVEYIPA